MGCCCFLEKDDDDDILLVALGLDFEVFFVESPRARVFDSELIDESLAYTT